MINSMVETEQEAPNGEENPPRGKLGARAAALVILVGAVVILFEAIGIASDTGIGPQQSGFFPIIVGIGLVVFGLGYLATTTFWPDTELIEHVSEEHQTTHWGTVWLAVGGLVGYSILLSPLGYILATFLFIMAITWVAGSRRWLQNLIVAILFPVAVYFSFTELLGVRLPAGLLEAVL